MPEIISHSFDMVIDEIGFVAETYHRLLLLVSQPPAEASRLIANIGAHLNCPVTNLNAELSSALLDLSHRQRQLKAHKVVGDIVDDEAADLVLFDHTDILFSPALQLDAVALLKSLSRNKTVVATWQGEIRGGKIQHAEEWHPEYQSHSIDDVRIIAVDRCEHRDGWKHSGGIFDV